MKKVGKIRSVMVSAAIFAAILAGCGNRENVSPDKNGDIDSATAQESVAGSVSDEAAEEGISDIEETEKESTEEATVEEAQVEEDTSNLSNEEWVDSLNVERPTFLVFNELTGERKALEDGAEYTLVEGDELAMKMPSRWLLKSENVIIYNDKEAKYACIVYDLNMDMITDKTEFIVTYKSREGEDVSATVYLSK